MTAMGEVTRRVKSTAGTPTEIVSGFASPRETYGDEVGADLAVDREQGGQGVLNGQCTDSDLCAHENPHDLCDRAARAEDRRQERKSDNDR